MKQQPKHRGCGGAGKCSAITPACLLTLWFLTAPLTRFGRPLP